MAGETSAIGGISVAASGVNTGYTSFGENNDNKDTKKVAYLNSIWQSIPPSSTASAVRA